MPYPRSPSSQWVANKPVSLGTLAPGQQSSAANTAGSASALAGGSGTWTNPTNAAGTDDATYAVWTVP